MNRTDYASALMEGSAGYDDDGPHDEVFGVDDPVKRAGLSTLTIQLTIANAQVLGNAAAGVNLFDATDVDAAALPTGIATPTLANYKLIVKYLLASPALLQSISFISSETTSSGAPLLSSLILTPQRVTPFGLQNANAIQLQSYQTTQDFQVTRSTVPLRTILDGFSRLNLTSGTNASGGTITINCVFFIGKRVEARKQIKGGPAMTMRPGGRGPTPVK